MYAQLKEGLPDLTAVGPADRLGWRHLLGNGVSRNVLHLGLTSLFTDVSSEMISTVLPLYLMVYMRLSPLEYGFVDGLYQGASALVRVFGAYFADRWQRYKEVAALGYGLSAVCKLGMLVVGPAWTAFAAIVLLDRTGKGIRTAPRDALISLSTERNSLGLAFGAHRALDTLGAMLGPLIAFAVLMSLPNAFDLIFVMSFGFAVVGLAVLGLFVENRSPRPVVARPKPVGWTDAFALMRQPAFRRLIIAGTLLALATISDGFVFLVLQRRLEFTTSLIPLLYVLTSLFYLLLAIPAGRLADRFGRGRIFVGGYALLLLVYASLLVPAVGPVQLFVSLVCFGAYYASTDGILMALAAETLVSELRSSGMALLTTAIGVSRLAASLVFGLVWMAWGAEWATGTFLVALSLALGSALWVLAQREGPSAAVREDVVAA